ncbi:MAG: hypothetical protein WAO00_01355, partial [Chthoniobacterales bacterium]
CSDAALSAYHRVAWRASRFYGDRAPSLQLGSFPFLLMLLIVIMLLRNSAAAQKDHEHDHDQEHDWA